MSATLHLVSTNDEDVSIRVDETKNSLADGVDSLSVVTSYAHALLNTSINPATTPPEAWYNTINTNLNTAKKHAMTWNADIAPKIGSVIPQTIINYDNTFQSATDEILTILNTAKQQSRNLTLQEKKDIIELVEATLAAINEQQDAVKGVQSALLTTVNDFQDDHTALVTGQNSAANAVKLANEERVRIEGKINELQTKLSQARARVTAAGIGLGLAIFVAVAAFALAAATGGVGGFLVVGAIGVIGVGTAATFTGIYTAEINSLIDEINQQQNALSEKKRQITALTGLVGTMNSLREKNEGAKRALTSIQTMWDTMAGKMESVLAALKKESVDAGIVAQRMNINDARKAWTQAREFAESIQKVTAGTSVQPVFQHDTLRMAFR